MSIMQFTQSPAPTRHHGSPVMHSSPERDFAMLRAVSHVCQTWMHHVPETGPRRAGAMSALLSAESAMNDLGDRDKTAQAIAAFCASCKSIHPDLAVACINRDKPEAGLAGCWLIGLLAGAKA